MPERPAGQPSGGTGTDDPPVRQGPQVRCPRHRNHQRSEHIGIRRPHRPVHYRTAAVGGVNVFYREAGPDSGPVVILLHGFPSSSRMFRDLIPRLSDAYRVIAPNYPAFGHSAGRPAS